MRKRAFKILKISGIVLGIIIVLLILATLSLRLPAVQNYVKNYMVDYLEDKIETPVQLDKIYVDFPNSIVMENLYLQGQKKDTLLYAQKFDVGLDILKLLDNAVDLTSIDLERVRANVVRDQDGRFNFDYIIDAFVTEDSAATEQEPWVISLDKIHLKDIGVKFHDLQQRNDLQVYFNNFETTVETFDLNENTYGLDKIVLDGLNLHMQQDLVKEVAVEAEQEFDSLNAQKPLKLQINQIAFTNFDVDYADDNTKTYGQVAFQELKADINKIDLEHQLYDIDQLLLADADLDINLYLAETDTQQDVEREIDEAEVDASADTNMTFILDDFELDHVALVYNNQAMPHATEGMDFNHLDFPELSLEANGFKMEDGTFEGEIESARIQEKDHLNITTLETNFKYANQEAYLKDLLLKTDNTVLRDEIVLSYDDMSQLTNNPEAVMISANIPDARIAFEDILAFMPSLGSNPPFNQYPNAVVNVDAKVHGTLNEIMIEQLQANGIGDLQLDVNGTIKNATDPDNLYFDVNINQFSGSKSTIENLVPKGTLPDNISLPNTIQLTGTARGTTEIINADLNLKSSDGNADVVAYLDLSKENNEKYDVQADVADLNIGKIIQNKGLGKVSGKINAVGRSFDFTRGSADITGNIRYLDYNQYRYNNVALNGELKQGHYDIDLDSKDQNANLTLRANGEINEDNPTVALSGNIRSLDLHRLNFYSEPLALAGNINGAFSNLDPDNLNGEFTLTNFAIADGEDVYPMQEVHFVAVNNAASNNISLSSQVVDANLSGNFVLTEILESLMQTINSYYEFQEPQQLKPISPNQYVDFDIQIKDDKVIRKFITDLKEYETIVIQGNYTADTQQLNVNGEIPHLTYGAYHIEAGKLDIHTEENQLMYGLNVGAVSSESFALNQLNLHGDIANNIINFDLSTQDTEDNENYLIAGNVESLEDVQQISLNPDGLMLNGENWEVAEGNQLQINSQGGIYANNFTLSNGDSSIKIESEGQGFNSPLGVDISNFEIATITEIIKKEDLPASGLVNGHLVINNLQSNMTFTSDLEISDLNVYEQAVGTLHAKVNSQNADVLDIDVALSENGNDVDITGTYTLSNAGLDLLVDIKKLNMKSIEGFTMNELQETEGDLSGELKVGGSTENLSVLGAIYLNDVGFKIAQTGSDFRNINDEIFFEQEGIVFDQFDIHDKSGNTLLIDGKILTQTYQDFAFNLDVSAQDFKVVDSEENVDQIMYGILAIDTDMHVGGDLDLPKVDGAIALTDITDFTFVLPQSSPTLEEREGIVRFVDKDLTTLDGTLAQDSISTESNVKGMDVNMEISVTKEAKISILIDKATGDFVKLQGDAKLTGGIDPSGKTTLVGVYEISDGAYELNINFLNRRFDIQEGSTITWNGDPLEATLDITAIYNIEAAPIDLLQQQLSGMAPAQYNMYKQRIPFETKLMMHGDLMKPEITFDIQMQEDYNAVAGSVIENTETKLQQIRQDESEMNKQVFALLLMNRFIGENPFQSQSGVSVESMARESVSQILSQQLNNLASDLIAGVDLDFDFDSYEDYSSGQKDTRTDLNVGLSKRLLNDRLKITVGSKFGLEGSARTNEELTNIAGDLKIDYMLSKNGRYTLRAFRTNDYEVALQGQIIETGVGFIISLEYDEFKDIFKKAKGIKE